VPQQRVRRRIRPSLDRSDAVSEHQIVRRCEPPPSEMTSEDEPFPTRDSHAVLRGTSTIHDPSEHVYTLFKFRTSTIDGGSRAWQEAWRGQVTQGLAWPVVVVPLFPGLEAPRQRRQVKRSVIEFLELAAVSTADAFDMAVARGRAGQEDEVRNLPFIDCRGARVAPTVSAGGARTLVPAPPDRGQPSPGR
jgi:hypothetical protein